MQIPPFPTKLSAKVLAQGLDSQAVLGGTNLASSYHLFAWIAIRVASWLSNCHDCRPYPWWTCVLRASRILKDSNPTVSHQCCSITSTRLDSVFLPLRSLTPASILLWIFAMVFKAIQLVCSRLLYLGWDFRLRSLAATPLCFTFQI